MNDKLPIQSSPLRRRAELFNTVGVALLVLGFIAASLIYWSGENGPATKSQGNVIQDQENSWKDGTIAPADLKGSSRTIEMNYGKIAVLIVSWLHRWEELKPHQWLAIVVAAITILAAVGCFLVAKRLPRGRI